MSIILIIVVIIVIMIEVRHGAARIRAEGARSTPCSTAKRGSVVGSAGRAGRSRPCYSIVYYTITMLYYTLLLLLYYITIRRWSRTPGLLGRPVKSARARRVSRCFVIRRARFFGGRGLLSFPFSSSRETVRVCLSRHPRWKTGRNALTVSAFREAKIVCAYVFA